MLPPNELEETINIADDVDTVADLPRTSARIFDHSPGVAEILSMRRRREFPIFMRSEYINSLLTVLIWPEYHRLYEVDRVIMVDEVQAQYRVNFETLPWYRIDRTIDVKPTGECCPMFYVFYFTDTQWTLVYKNKLSKEEKLQRRRFNQR